MESMGKIPYTIAKVLLKGSLILLAISIVLNALAFINIYNSIQAPIDLINNSVATNNFVPPEVCTVLAGTDTLTTLTGTDTLTTMHGGILGNLVGGDVKSVQLSNATELQALDDRNYGDSVSYTLTVTFTTKVWTLFGSAYMDVPYKTNQVAVCYRKIR